jgi:DNA-binding SARP family transcriptional activator
VNQMANSDQARTQILLLGRFAVVRGQSSLQAAAWKRRKAAVLLQRLALERRLLKEQAIDFLWPDASLAAGADNLYRTIYALRQTLNDAFGAQADQLELVIAAGVCQALTGVADPYLPFRDLLAMLNGD